MKLFSIYFSGSVIMVVGGSYHNDAQLSSLSRSCSNLQNYPIAIRSATGAIVSGNPMICGGLSYGSKHSECYQHNKAINSWKFVTNMTTERYFSASVPVNNKLLVLGGWDGKNDLATTEFVSPDGDPSQPGPDLPAPRSLHCAVTLSNGGVMLIGGEPDEKSVIIFHPNTNEFDQSLPPLIFERTHFGCAAFKSPLHDNREVVVAAGGSGTATAEVLDYSQPNPAWTESN